MGYVPWDQALLRHGGHALVLANPTFEHCRNILLSERQGCGGAKDIHGQRPQAVGKHDPYFIAQTRHSLELYLHSLPALAVKKLPDRQLCLHRFVICRRQAPSILKLVFGDPDIADSFVAPPYEIKTWRGAIPSH